MAPRESSGLTVRVGTDLEALADDLAARLAVPVLGVLEPEVVVVPTPGIGRWLEARLGGALGAGTSHDGIAANVEMLLSGALIRRVAALGGGDAGAWSVGRTTVACLAALQEPDHPALAALRDQSVGGLFPVARAAADLFDRLFLWRPDVADEWLGGAARDPRAALLQLVADRVGTPPTHRSLIECFGRLAAGDDDGLELPARLFVFGGDSLPGGPTFTRTIDALGQVRDVTMHVVAPSLRAFESVRAATPRWEGGRAPDQARPEPDPTVHPLLATWGAASADTAALLAQLPERATTHVGVVDVARAPSASLLDALQRSVRGEEVDLVAPDTSVALHACVGERRQVEAARDAVLGALSDDPTLEPSDVVVLCTELSQFAPHVVAVLGDPQGSPALPFVLRDRAVSRAVPLVAATESALGLLGGRFPRSAVLDLLRAPACARRFGLGEEDLDRITEWAGRALVRWGLDGETRAAGGLPTQFDAGTWRRATDRLLAGVALFDGVASDELGVRALSPGHDLERVGSLCQAIATLEALDAEAASARPLAAWCEFARDLAAALFEADRDDAAEVEQLQGLLAGIEDDATGIGAAVAYAEFRSMFSDRAAQVRDLVATGPGGVTVASLAPLRNVPFRVVVLLGLDEAHLGGAMGLDLAFGEPRVGDRDHRADLRAALLGAVLAARDRLIVTYTDRDLVTNERVPVAAALVELVEAVGLVCTEHPEGARGVTFTHPRHAHGDGDLLGDERLGGRPFSFDGDALGRAGELRGAQGVASTSRLEAAGAATRDEATLAQLADFLGAPQLTFLRATLGVRLPSRGGAADDELPTELDGLERWRVTNELVRRALEVQVADDRSFDEMVASWRAAPDHAASVLPGILQDRALLGPSGAVARARALHAKVAAAYGVDGHETRRVDVTLREGLLRGPVVVFHGDTVVHWTPSADDGKVRLRSTVELLALTVAQPEVAWRSTRIWLRDASGAPHAARATLIARGATPSERRDRAEQSLETLFGLWRRGLAEPVPLLPRVTLKMAEACREQVAVPSELVAKGAAGWGNAWERGDGGDPAVQFCFGMSYEQLCDLPVRASDPDVGHDHGGARLLAYSLAMLEGIQAIDPASHATGVGAP